MDGLRVEAENAEMRADLGKAAEIRYGKIPALQKSLETYATRLKKLQKSRRILKEEITSEDIAEVVARWTGIPLVKMIEEERAKLERMEQELGKRVVGQDEAIKNQSSIKTLQDYINKLQSMIQAGNATKVNLALNNLKRFADTLKQNELNLELEQNFTKDRAIFTKSIESTQAYKEFTNLVDQFSQQSGTIRSNDLSNLLTKLDGLEEVITTKLNAAKTLKLFIEKNPDFKNRIKNFDIKYNRLLLTEDELNDFKTKITDQINNLNNRSFIDKLLDPIKEFFGIGNSARSTIIKELKAQYKNYNKQLQGISESTFQNIFF